MPKEMKKVEETEIQEKLNKEINQFKKIKQQLKLQIIKNIQYDQENKSISSKSQSLIQHCQNKYDLDSMRVLSRIQTCNQVQQKEIQTNKYEQAQGLVKEFLKAGYKANLILKMNKETYKEYLFKIWDSNKNLDFNQIMKSNHKNIIWWQNQLIPKKYLKLITELVASINTANITLSKEIQSLKTYTQKMDEYILAIRRKWNYQSLQINKKFSNQQLSTIYSVNDSICYATSRESALCESQFLAKRQQNNHSISQFSQQKSNFNLPQQLNQNSNKKIQQKQNSNESLLEFNKNQQSENQNFDLYPKFQQQKKNIYFDNEFTDIIDDEEIFSDGSNNLEANGENFNQASQQKSNRIPNNQNFSQNFEDQNSNNSNYSSSIKEKETFYFNTSFYSQFKNNSHIEGNQKNFSINFPKFLEIDGLIQSI